MRLTINQVVSRRFVKKQQMPWTPRGGHRLLQTRTKVLNGELAAMFQEWQPPVSRKSRLILPPDSVPLSKSYIGKPLILGR